MIAKIAVSAANFAIDKPYSYFVPVGMTLEPGIRVIVSFGRGNRKAKGVVLSLLTYLLYKRLSPLLHVKK